MTRSSRSRSRSQVRGGRARGWSELGVLRWRRRRRRRRRWRCWESMDVLSSAWCWLAPLEVMRLVLRRRARERVAPDGDLPASLQGPDQDAGRVDFEVGGSPSPCRSAMIDPAPKIQTTQQASPQSPQRAPRLTRKHAPRAQAEAHRRPVAA